MPTSSQALIMRSARSRYFGSSSPSGVNAALSHGCESGPGNPRQTSASSCWMPRSRITSRNADWR